MQAKPIIFSVALALACLPPAGAQETSADAPPKPPPAIPVVLYADPPTVDDVPPAIIAARNALRNDRRLEVMLFNPEAPTFVLGARHAQLSLSPDAVASLDQRKAMTEAVSGSFFAVLTLHGRRSKNVDAVLYEVAPVSQSWPFPDRAPDSLAADLASQVEAANATASPTAPAVPANAAVSTPIPVAPTPSSVIPVPSLPTPSVVIQIPAAPPPVVAPVPAVPVPVPSKPAPEVKPEAPAPVAPAPAPPAPKPIVPPIQATPPAPAVPTVPAAPTPAEPTVKHDRSDPGDFVPMVSPPKPANAVSAPKAVPAPMTIPPAAPKAAPAIVAPPVIVSHTLPSVNPPASPETTAVTPALPAIANQAAAAPTAPADPPTAAVTLPASPPPGTVVSDDARRLMTTGDLQQRATDYYAAIDSYRQAIDLAPRAAEPRLRLAQAYLQAGMREQAISEARRAHALDPSNQDARDFLTTLGASDTDETQITTNQASVTANPKDQTAWIALGDSCWNANKLSDALAAYKNAVDLDPSAVGPQTRLARFYAAQGDYGKSLSALDKAGSDGYPYALEIIASATENLFGEIDAAEELFERNETTREQCYKRLKAADKAAQGLADFVAKVTPSQPYKLSHLHRQLSTRLLAQDTAAWLGFTETGQTQDKSIAITLEKEAVREMETAASAERAHSIAPSP